LILLFALISPSAWAQPTTAPRASFEIESGALKIPVPVVFESGTTTLKAESTPALEHVADYLTVKSDITLLRIEGHTDSDGDPAANQSLSNQRALAVAKWLVGKGIDCKRLLPVGFGGNKPVAPNDTPENKALNRRTVFANAAMRGHLIGGMPADGGGQIGGDPCS
jgi:OOP family OmpA-OmpF porin